MPHGGSRLDTAGFLTTRDLRGRGWTDAVVGKFMREPDVTHTNPHYALSPPMRFYDPARVERLEALPDVAAALAQAAVRSARAKRAAETRVAR